MEKQGDVNLTKVKEQPQSSRKRCLKVVRYEQQLKQENVRQPHGVMRMGMENEEIENVRLLKCQFFRNEIFQKYLKFENGAKLENVTGHSHRS
jgi:hypothetical protein